MEWRIILPVLCVFGILLVPGSTAVDSSAANSTSTNVTSANSTSTNVTGTNVTSANSTATNVTGTNVTSANSTATNATATNVTGTNVTSANSTATNVTGTNVTSANSTATNATATNGTSANSTSTNGTSANSTSTNGTSANSTSTNGTSANSTSTNGTSANSTSTNATASNGTSTNTTTDVVAQFNLTFSINETFKDVYSNLAAPETIALKERITNQIEPLYKKRFPNFLRYAIRKFRSGSIVTEGALEFNTSNSNPNVTELSKVLVEAIASGNLSINIKNDSITITAPDTTTVTPSTTTNTIINVTFSINETFTDALSNLSSPEAVSRISNITTQFVGVFRKRYTNIVKMLIRKFSKGSIKTEGGLEFNGTAPKAQDVVTVISEAVKNGNFTFQIDPKSIIATDSSGTFNSTTAGSPVISSMFTVLWMTLASLLLSGVMHL